MIILKCANKKTAEIYQREFFTSGNGFRRLSQKKRTATHLRSHRFTNPAGKINPNFCPIFMTIYSLKNESTFIHHLKTGYCIKC